MGHAPGGPTWNGCACRPAYGGVRHLERWAIVTNGPLFRSKTEQRLAEPGGSKLDSEVIMDEQNITALCAGPITVDPGTDTVNFLHYTAYDCFEEKRQAYLP